MSFTTIGTNRLCRDPELKYTANEMAVCNFAVACDGRRKDDPASFVDCTAFGKTAEFIAKWFTKGKPIDIVGELRQDRWEDKQTGQKRSKLYVVVDRATFATGVPKDEGNGPSEPAQEPQAGGGYDDDIGDPPF